MITGFNPRKLYVLKNLMVTMDTEKGKRDAKIYPFEQHRTADEKPQIHGGSSGAAIRRPEGADIRYRIEPRVSRELVP